MASRNLLAAPWLSVEKFVSRRDLIELHATSRQKDPPCPLCQTPSRRIQSRYSRVFADLPWQGVAVRIHLQVRRFFCDVAECPRRVFTERLPELAAPYARRTLRLAEALEVVGFALGGEPGARTATALGIKASPDTVLQAIRRAAMPVPETPRVLGIDDWALRRGHRYATVLVDLERHCRVDVLPDRKAETVKAWLEQHPGVEVISRDRGGAYAEGARCGAPSALQVADRWHLLKNLGEAVERFLATQHQALTAVGKALTEEARRERIAETSATSATTQGDRDEPPEGSWRSRVEQQRHAKRARRLARYQQVMELFKAGWSKKAIARETDLDVKTVRKYLAAPSFPEQAARRRRSSVDPYRAYLEQRWTEGCRNATQLHRELCERGYSGGVAAVRRVIAGWRQGDGRGRWKRDGAPGQKPAKLVSAPSPRRTMWLLMRDTSDLDRDELAMREKLLELCPGAVEAMSIALKFQEIVRGRRNDQLEAWLSRARASGIAALAAFAVGLEADRGAVEAALTSEWSNGQVEGQVNRIKAIKRTMYGRASFDLLRRRILRAG